ncbi:hypothetical protein HDE_00629 [Halotydeus destructor]|nr:hypothetical protein HDE_00629 [Halotydeus destructor]
MKLVAVVLLFLFSLASVMADEDSYDFLGDVMDLIGSGLHVISDLMGSDDGSQSQGRGTSVGNDDGVGSGGPAMTD